MAIKYLLDPNISVEQWKELVLDEEIFNEKSLFTFACLLKAKEPSCYAMSKEFSYNKWNLEPFNLFSAQIRSTGQRICKKLNLNSESFWNICCIGEENSEKHFCFEIRPELKKAFDETKVLDEIEIKEKNMSNLQNYINLLTSNKNIIFHGAPGTGKTYTARQIAKQMIFGTVKDDSEMTEDEKELFNKHFGFVQFHPSYDYTDFVEGLRPVKSSESSQISFERKDGVFKTFCKNALKDFNDSKKSNESLKEEYSLAEAFYDLCEKFQSGEITEIILRDTSHSMVIDGINDDSTAIYLKTKNSSKDRFYTISSNRLSKLAEVYKTSEDLDNLVNIDKSIRDVIGGCNTSGYWATLKKLYELKKNQSEPIIKIEDEKAKDKPYIFVIDEINRGELSKIFGELFYCIDSGYRGEKGKIATQYQNLVEDDAFENGFFIPENVFIIGTMNDIDRSVECMDFAMRRRFTFVEITAEESAESMNLCDESKIRMSNLNCEIEKKGLSSSFHIGASYFRNAENKAQNGEVDYENLWKMNLEPLLNEYLRGQNDVVGKLEELKKAFEKE